MRGGLAQRPRRPVGGGKHLSVSGCRNREEPSHRKRLDVMLDYVRNPSGSVPTSCKTTIEDRSTVFLTFSHLIESRSNESRS